MTSTVLKLLLTPALVGAASLAGWRWGPAVSGWIVGLPFTSGPIAFFLALDSGTEFAAAAAEGTLAGAISQAAFCLAYGWIGPRQGWPLALAAGCFGFGIATAALQYVVLIPLGPLFVVVVVALIVAVRLMPAGAATLSRPNNLSPRWDVPARMVLATGFVLLLTGLAPALGPRLAGLLAPFPVYAAILTVFAHQLQGPAAAAMVLRGLLLGLFAFAGFFLVLAALVESAGIAAAFAAAIAVALVLQAGSLWVLRRVPETP